MHGIFPLHAVLLISGIGHRGITGAIIVRRRSIDLTMGGILPDIVIAGSSAFGKK